MAAAMLFVVAGSASAAVVYDNGAPNYFSANEMSQWIQSEDFALSADTTLVGATFAYEFTTSFQTLELLQYFIYADGISNSQHQPGALLVSGVASVTSTADISLAGHFPEFESTFTFETPFIATADTTYWLGLHSGSTFARNDIYWATTNANATLPGWQNDHGDTSWQPTDQEHSFSLNSSAAPEPTTWAMMLLGIGGVGTMLRRSRQPAAPVASC